MSSINKVILIGRLGQDPESKTAANGVQLAKFSIATSEKYKEEERTEWHNIVTFGKTAEHCALYLRKGSQVYIEGSLRTSNWEKDGTKHYKTEISANSVKFLDSKRKDVVSKTETNQPKQDVTTADIPF